MNPLRSLRVRAFTLIELLVVIGIIVLLAALLMPAIIKVQDSSKMTAAQSNLRQLGSVVMSYVNDTGKYPPGSDAGLGSWLPCNGEVTPTWRGYWSDILSPYLGLNSYWGSQTSPIFDSPAKLIKTAAPTVAFTPNPQIIQDTQWGSGHVIPASRVTRQSSVILLGDAVQDPVHGWVCFLPWQQSQLYDSDPNNADQYIDATNNKDDASNQFRFRYGNKGQFLFCDGHVELIENGKLQKKNFAISY